MKVACAQYASPLLDPQAAVARVVDGISEAATHRANLVAFPEGFIGGHPDWLHFMVGSSAPASALAKRLLDVAITPSGPEVQEITEAARRTQTAVVVGAALKDRPWSGTVYNAMLFVDELGALRHIHRKLVPTTVERLVHGPGDAAGLRAMPLQNARVTGLICGENSNPLARLVCAAEGPDVHVAAWPAFFSPSSPSMPMIATLVARSLAYELGSYVMSVAGVWRPESVRAVGLGDDTWAYAQEPEHTGGSAIFGPRGDIVACASPGPHEELVVADINRDAVLGKRVVHDFNGHYNRPDIFRVRIDRRRAALISVEDDGDPRGEVVDGDHLTEEIAGIPAKVARA